MGIGYRALQSPDSWYTGAWLELCPPPSGNHYAAWNWKDATKVHHAFRLTDAESGRVLEETLEIHTLALGRYNIRETDLKTANLLDCWLFWFLHAHEYEADALLKLFPQQAIRQATLTIVNIAQVTEDKVMYDAREKAIRDRQWAMNAAHREGVLEGELKGEIKGKIKGKIEGKVEGEIKLIRTLQTILCMPVSEEQELRALDLARLELLTNNLQDQLRNRKSS